MGTYTLTFTTDSPEELAAAAKALPWALGAQTLPAAPIETKALPTAKTEDKPAKAKAAKAVKAPEPEAPAQTLDEEPDAFDAAEPKKAPTRADVSQAYIKLSAAKGKEFALGILGKLGVKGIKELDESQFEEAVAQASAAMGN